MSNLVSFESSWTPLSGSAGKKGNFPTYCSHFLKFFLEFGLKTSMPEAI